MSLPNFRLYDTQARFSLVCGVLALGALVVLAVVTFRGLNQGVVLYHPSKGFSQYRPLLVYVVGAVTILLGVTGGLLGFRSLGQARNTKQGFSWMGMLICAAVTAIAPVMIFAWKTLAEPVLQQTSGS